MSESPRIIGGPIIINGPEDIVLEPVGRPEVPPDVTPELPPGPVDHAPADGVISVRPISELGDDLPVDAKLVARINEISAHAVGSSGGTGEDVTVSLFNIMDALAPICASLANHPESMAKFKSALDAEHLSDQELVQSLQALHAKLDAIKGLDLANGVYPKLGATLNPALADTVRDGFGASIESLDFDGDAEGAAAHINEAIEKATEIRGEDGEVEKEGIKDLVTADAVAGKDTVVTSALAFKGDWTDKFDKDLTDEDAKFKTADGNDHTVAMMKHLQQSGVEWETAKHGDFQAVRMNFGNGTYMVAVAPSVGAADRAAALPKLLADLKDGDVYAALDFRSLEGTINIPRFATEAESDPIEILENAGLPVTDLVFPGILENAPPLQVTAGVHKATFEIDEEGGKGQAATALMFESFGVAVPAEQFFFNADVPFAFAVFAEATDAQGGPADVKLFEGTREAIGE